VITKKKKVTPIVFLPVDSLIKVKSDHLHSFVVTSITATEIQLKMKFENAETISNKDILRIKMNFDFVRLRNPDLSVNLEALVTRKTRKHELSSASKLAANAALSFTLVVKMIMQGSLQQVWGMINGLQIIVHMSLM